MLMTSTRKDTRETPTERKSQNGSDLSFNPKGRGFTLPRRKCLTGGYSYKPGWSILVLVFSMNNMQIHDHNCPIMNCNGIHDDITSRSPKKRIHIRIEEENLMSSKTS